MKLRRRAPSIKRALKQSLGVPKVKRQLKQQSGLRDNQGKKTLLGRLLGL